MKGGTGMGLMGGGEVGEAGQGAVGPERLHGGSRCEEPARSDVFLICVNKSKCHPVCLLFLTCRRLCGFFFPTTLEADLEIGTYHSG